MQDQGTDSQRPVTVLATRRARPGCEAEFETFLARLQRVVAASPGNLGMTFVPPSGADREYVVVYRYDGPASLRAWHSSPERAAMIDESAELTEAPPRERALTGLETWFTTPGAGVVRAPARWRMWLLSACGIYPIITLVSVLFGPVLAPLPPPLRFALVTPVLSATMTWLVMPALSHAFARLLYR
ncbi:MAG TPA: antibiotic biosynthesis monooxygenase [Streptosporangiaceae bacterium]|jgi:hypothetical protein